MERDRLLFVDAFNYANVFFRSQNDSLERSFIVGLERIRLFCHAAKESGFRVKVFLDLVQDSQEANKKWFDRRRRETLQGIMDVPQGLSTIMTDAFSQVDVITSLQYDNDDVLASMAQRDGALVLSRDKDFFRYKESSFEIYSDFTILSSSSSDDTNGNNRSNNRLVLIPCNKNTVVAKDRVLLSGKELEKSLLVNAANVKVSAMKTNKIYKRGTGSPLIKELGNPHIIIRPLRQALYARLGITEPIKEIFPVWREHQVDFVCDLVGPDSSYDFLLDKPTEALAKFTTVKPETVQLKQWEKHLFCMKSVVFEVCHWAGRTGMGFCDLMKSTLSTGKGAVLSGNDVLDMGFSTLNGNWEYVFRCKICKTNSGLTASELHFYRSKNFSLPKRCKRCRKGH